MALSRIDRDFNREAAWRYEGEDRLDDLLDGGEHMTIIPIVTVVGTVT